MKRIIALFLGVFLTLSIFSLTGCKDDGNFSMTNEDSWSDENVDNDAWT